MLPIPPDTTGRKRLCPIFRPFSNFVHNFLHRLRKKSLSGKRPGRPFLTVIRRLTGNLPRKKNTFPLPAPALKFRFLSAEASVSDNKVLTDHYKEPGLRQAFQVNYKRVELMSGHSKWANIQHRKGRQDAKRSNLWTKLVREIIVAARVGGGGDPDMNSRLRLAVLKAREGNVPKDTINNAILKGTGQLEGVSYEEVRYEGYGIGGASLIIDCTTDNRTRTVADVRHILSKHGGNLGTEGSVSFQFKHCGEFLFAPGTDEDKVMETALEAGADDVMTAEDGSIEVVCDPAAFDAVAKAFETAGLTPVASDVTMKPLNEVELKGEDAEKMRRLIDALEDLDDVSHVYTSAVFEDEPAE